MFILLFFVKKKNKRWDFREKLSKTPYNTGTIFLKCNVFYARYIVFILQFFVKKRTKGENSERIWAKAPYNTARIFKKCNVFYASYIVFIFQLFVKKRTKGENSENFSKNSIMQQQFTKNVPFFMRGTLSLF